MVVRLAIQLSEDASAEATVEGLKKAFEGFAHENEAVQTALEKDLAYVLRFLK